ncbi:TIGR03619 family F420-dependent LLM class oxidoreductase [Streptomyces rapamycinicus]|uniref:Hydride transferase n=2 Tax=Streptomyces rapamycinicus TaxID=1226757 RepID=A0A0A0NCY0_STRRN|nr:TIGR03619 family F420-dependent LLM class oxidoreductase [Streptomyces rapamycinicus]AGP54829.1 hydride transferase [Streptomyces rapamycinicus NRRL 5491]MBB4782351.1 putative F420-dependent oxidoreductase [Streptomyces rapamycinicus]RLV82165.1 hydride transferase [Streptomyces rapamycinicus NRRL 5491]UTO62872.1 TIGR03619 family F420-dependent LLM class oxidoreductase [Streptomyces rapamycinicus]UTP30830.1 TIGR03619 family F420-dependent LLM class oxidoreductase [Streptomyces rapamycinicus 
MRIGFALPQFGPLAHHPEDIARFARQAEELGADSLWVGDRLLAPVDPIVGYAGTDVIPSEFRAALDPFAVLATAAAATERVGLGTDVINAPWYPPALLARSLTTVDLLSAGRLLVGLGTGWSPEEYEAVDVPMAERGRRLDECLDALDAWWTRNPVEYRGDHWAVPASHVDLKPASRPRPPVYLAAFAPAAMRRVARRADGWLPIVVVPAGSGAPDPIAALAERLPGVREAVEREGRDPAAFDTILRVNPSADASVEDIATALVRAEREAGVQHAFVDLIYLGKDADQALDLVQRVLERARAS